MTSQPEKLFRDKLENFQRPAPSLAWSRIEANLDKSFDKKLWMKIAAGLLLLAVAGFFAWTIKPIEEPASIAKTDITVPKNNSTEKNISTENPTTNAANQIIVSKNITSKNNTNAIKKGEPALVEETIIKTPSIIEPSEMAVVETTSVKETSSRTIVYTAEEVNAKFLRKKSSSEATSVDKKSSSIQKLMGLAYTIKNPDNGIGDLRQKKDEILALNLLSTKEDKTNKEKN